MLVPLAALIGLLAPVIGCRGVFYAQPPDLLGERWSAIRVKYHVRGPGDARMPAVWSTTDRRMLDELRRSLHILRIRDLWGRVSSPSNEILLELSGGTRYLLYMNEPTAFCMHQTPDPQTGFGVKVTEGFYTTMRTLIAAERGHEALFWSRTHVPYRILTNQTDSVGQSHE